MFCITHMYEHFCVRCVLCDSTCISIYYLISVYNSIDSLTEKNEYCLVGETLLTDRAIFG